MDRVFAPPPGSGNTATEAAVIPPQPNDDSIEVEVREAPPRPSPRSRPRPTGPWRRLPRSWPAAGLICVACGLSSSLWLGWRQANQDLRQERTIRMLEGLRNLGSEASNGSAEAMAAGTTDGRASGTDSLPPPPPGEPWIEELNQLGNSSPGAATPLQVPLSGTLRAAAPPATAAFARPLSAPPPLPSGLDGAVPELVGVVQIPGRGGSAIFQMGGSSTNAGAGEVIGSSGWRLVSTNGESAVIERGGQQRRVSISSGF